MEFTKSEAKQWAKENYNGLEGVICPSFTPDLAELDEEGIRHDVRHAISQGFFSVLASPESSEMTLEERKKYLAEAHFNVFNLTPSQVTFDMCSVGTGAVSQEQMAGQFIGDEAYAGSRNFEALQKRFDMVLVNINVFQAELPEETRAMLAVKLAQDMPHHVAHIQNRPIDIKQDEEIFLGMVASCLLVVAREPLHPAFQENLPSYVFFHSHSYRRR